MRRYAGGGHKINMLVRDLAPYKDDKDLVIMFTDRLIIDGIVLYCGFACGVGVTSGLLH